jgi:hypothetical protein
VWFKTEHALVGAEDALMWRHFEQLTNDVRLELATVGQAS